MRRSELNRTADLFYEICAGSYTLHAYEICSTYDILGLTQTVK